MKAHQVLTEQPNFRRLWIGQSASFLGTAVSEIAIPLTAAVYLDASPWQMGLLVALEFLPWLLVGLLAGVWVDRRNRKRIMVSADLLRFGLLAIIPLTAWAGVLRMELLLVIVLAVGVGNVFFESAASAVIPQLVRKDLLVEANSLVRLSHSVSFVGGPGLGGWLVHVLTAPIAVVVDAFSYLFSAFFVGRVRLEAQPSTGDADRKIAAEISEGVRTVLRHRYLRPAVIATATLAFANGIFAAVYIIFLLREVGLNPALVALPYMVFGAASVAGALVAGTVSRRIGLGPSMVVTGALCGVATLVIPMLDGPPVNLVFMLLPWLVFGAISPIYGSTMQTLIQTATPARLLGRVLATSNVLSWGSQSLAALLGGALASLIGPRGALFVACFFYLLAPALMFFSPARSLREAPDIPEQDDTDALRDVLPDQPVGVAGAPVTAGRTDETDIG